MLVFVGIVMRLMIMLVIVLMGVRMLMSLSVWAGHSLRKAHGGLCPTSSRRVRLPIHNYIDFDSADAAAVHARNFKTCSDVEGFDCLLKDSGRNSGVNKSAEKHIAANAGEAV